MESPPSSVHGQRPSPHRQRSSAIEALLSPVTRKQKPHTSPESTAAAVAEDVSEAPTGFDGEGLGDTIPLSDTAGGVSPGGLEEAAAEITTNGVELDDVALGEGDVAAAEAVGEEGEGWGRGADRGGARGGTGADKGGEGVALGRGRGAGEEGSAATVREGSTGGVGPEGKKNISFVF